MLAPPSMPRKLPFEIVLTKAERQELTARAARYTRPYFEVLRAKMILLAAEGGSNEAIARSLARAAKSCRSGVSASLKNVSPGWRIRHARAARGFPPRGRRHRQSARL